MPRPAKGARLYYKAADDRWVIRDTGGIERGTGCSYGEREAAERALQAYLSEKHTPDFGRGDPATVEIADVLKLYADEHAAGTKRPDVAWSALPHLITFFDGKKVAHATPNLCRAYAKWRTSQPQARFKFGPGYRYATEAEVPRVGDQTARRELGVLSAAFGYAHSEHKLLYPVPVTMPDRAPARDRWLSRSQAAALLLAALGFRPTGRHDAKGKEIWRRPREKARPGEGRGRALFVQRHVARFILAGLYTGTRHEAILRLKWIESTDGGFVDLRSGIIYRRGTAEGESSKRRTPIPMSKRLAAHMRRWRKNGAYVIEFDGKPILRLRRAWTTARKGAELGDEITPHVLRHTFATWAVMAGVPFGKVARALGTTEQVVEQVYGHHLPEHLRGVVETVSRGGRS
ncbi:MULTISPECIES: site-specific integrase [unclassified Methylobacterium]|uniref:site-specific integrase n=1 Tax=unclassified Methylobacterium TaxID=2615210 RepID=UPI00068DE143|nr:MULTISPECIES: site-specific integrase [unclassified Methylobacterium]SFV11896.1 Phage integrase family protein [Methylobacterium sp. UNCCL125]